jgi:LuxR family transcriptional regulator, maltose regulon positive regulatory protein
MTFPRTKIQPPKQRPAYIERGALEARLAAALLTRRVVLVCAPAGYGKTSLVAHAVARLPQGHGLAWVSADAGDTLQRLLECLLAALEPLDPPWRVAPEALVHRVAESAEGERAAAAELINTLDAIDLPHGVIAIDDLHRIDDGAFFRFLDHLIERMSPRWTLVLASRTEPPIALGRLRAADELEELRQLQLQFARDEARALVTGAGLDEALADRVFDRTQGWPAGLRIAVGAVRGEAHWASSLEKALRSGERPMFEFLMTEVLDHLRPELAEFLLAVSVLPELEAARCAQVSGHAAAGALLNEIERLGLFVDALDAPARTLRLHDLFREALQQRLQLRDPGLFNRVRRQAAATEPDPVRRIERLVEIGDLDEAARLALAHVPTTIVRSGPAAASHILMQFPAAFRDTSPEIALVRGLLGWVHWDFAAMLEHFERAEAGFAAAGDRDRELLARAYRATILIALGHLDEAARALDSMSSAAVLADDARIAMLNAQCWLAIDTGRTRSVAAIVTKMLDLLERRSRIDLCYHTSPPIRMPGLPGIAEPLLRHAKLLLRAAGDEPTPLRPLGMLAQAWCALWRGELDQAARLRERAQQEASWTGNTGAVRSHMLALTAFAAAIDGNSQAALAAALTRVREQLPGPGPWSRYLLGVFGARVAAACRDVAVLREMLEQVTSAAAAMQAAGASWCRNPERPIAAQLAWLEGHRQEAVAGWRAALEDSDSLGIFGQEAETRVCLASALAEQKDLPEAAATLRPLFDQAAEDGGPGGALLAPRELRNLAAAPWGGLLAPQRQAALRAWCGLSREGAVPAEGAQAEGLTAREMQVLERIAAGESNKVIARALDLSLHTVKRHVANILGKLDLETRGQAAAWLAARR